MPTAPPLIYLDNAATSFPKPEPVVAAVSDFLANGAFNPGRSGYDASLLVEQRIRSARHDLGIFFGNPAADPDRTIFAANATDALNLAIQGVCRPGDHVVATCVDHNSVLRPLTMLRKAGFIRFDLARCDAAGRVDPAEVASLLRPETRLVILPHAGNVTGAVQPAAEVGALCRERGLLFLLDAAQTAGLLPASMADLGVDLLAFTGHKSLLGPTGTGGLIVGPDVPIRSVRWGGTGVRSAEKEHLDEFPYRLEAGTLNAAGIVGLAAGLAWIRQRGMENLLATERILAADFLAGCREIPGLTVLGRAPGADSADGFMPVISLNLDALAPEAVGQFLDADWNVAVRTGLHCAPLLHEALGTTPAGAVRFSFGPFNTAEHVRHALHGLRSLTSP